MRIPTALLMVLATLAPACSDAGSDGRPPDGSVREGLTEDRQDVLRPRDSEGSPASAAHYQEPGLRVVFLGTSLTEGYGLARPDLEAWPARIGALADSAGLRIEVVNAGLSGETSAGALRRLDWVLTQSPDILVIETGANDGLRALSVEQLEANLDGILSHVRETRPATRAVLLEMEAPPNLGTAYAGPFREAFGRVARRWDARLVPFFMDGVAGVPALNQGDAMHPTAEGHRIMAENAWPSLESVIRELETP